MLVFVQSRDAAGAQSMPVDRFDAIRHTPWSGVQGTDRVGFNRGGVLSFVCRTELLPRFTLTKELA